MDSLLLIGAVAVLAVGGFLWMRAAGGNKAGEDDGKGQAWRGTGATNIDPLLRNRHGIQNGDNKVWSIAEVKKHNKPDDLFIIVQNKVYDVTDYVEDHPGGYDAIVRYPGIDCTEQFSGIQHPAKVWDVLQDYYLGEIQPSEHVVYTFKTVSKL